MVSYSVFANLLPRKMWARNPASLASRSVVSNLSILALEEMIPAERRTGMNHAYGRFSG